MMHDQKIRQVDALVNLPYSRPTQFHRDARRGVVTYDENAWENASAHAMGALAEYSKVAGKLPPL